MSEVNDNNTQSSSVPDPTTNQAIYIGIDLGTSGVRACAISHSKALLHTCKATLDEPIKASTSITQDATLWWQATKQALGDLCQLIDTQWVKAISVNGTSGTVLACDTFGTPLAAARMYNDAFCTAQSERIRQVAPADSAAHGTSSGLAKILYLHEQYPQAERFLHQADWIMGKLSGYFALSDSNNALKSGYDPLRQIWPGWLSQLGLDIQKLPQVITPGSKVASLSPSTQQYFGLASDCILASGTTDSIAAFIATGAHQPGDAVTSLGSTLVLKILCEKPVAAAEYGIYSHRLGNYWLAGGASNTGGAALKHYVGDEKIKTLTPLLKPEQSTHLDYYPLIQAGERFPVNDPSLPPRMEPAAASELEYFQGILESISRIEKEGYDKLQQLGAPYPKQVFSAGGGSHNAGWSVIRQQQLAVPVKQALYSEACYGSALLAWQACNISGSST